MFKIPSERYVGYIAVVWTCCFIYFNCCLLEETIYSVCCVRLQGELLDSKTLSWLHQHSVHPLTERAICTGLQTTFSIRWFEETSDSQTVFLKCWESFNRKKKTYLLVLIAQRDIILPFFCLIFFFLSWRRRSVSPSLRSDYNFSLDFIWISASFLCFLIWLSR